MQTTSGAILLVIGVVALFAAIVGGGIKIKEIEVGTVPSRWRQGLLALFGLVVGGVGLALLLPDNETANAGTAQDNVAAGNENAPGAGTDEETTANEASGGATPADENAGADAGNETGTTGDNGAQ
jgi:hypothetical protein